MEGKGRRKDTISEASRSRARAIGGEATAQGPHGDRIRRRAPADHISSHPPPAHAESPMTELTTREKEDMKQRRKQPPRPLPPQPPKGLKAATTSHQTYPRHHHLQIQEPRSHHPPPWPPPSGPAHRATAIKVWPPRRRVPNSPARAPPAQPRVWIRAQPRTLDPHPPLPSPRGNAFGRRWPRSGEGVDLRKVRMGKRRRRKSDLEAGNPRKWGVTLANP